jgi:large subunit ribosomal protein L10
MREEKQLLLDEIVEKIEGSKGFIITSYQKFDAEVIRAFRNKVSENGGDFEVVRKRVFVKAAENKGIKLDLNTLAGHIGIVFVSDELSTQSKILLKFGEEKEDSINILGALIDGELVSGEEVKILATLPSLDEMRAMFVGLLQAPMAQTLAIFNEVLAGVPRCLEQKCKKD